MSDEKSSTTEQRRAEELAEVKAVLRCLCISFKEEMRLSQLSRDYRNTIGTEIPYRALGHASLLSLVRTELTDAIWLATDDYDPVVKPIVTKQLQNLHTLISKQKSSTSKGFPKKNGTTPKTYYNGPPQKFNANYNQSIKRKFSLQNHSTPTINHNSTYSPTSPGLNYSKIENHQNSSVHKERAISSEQAEYRKLVETNLQTLMRDFKSGLWMSECLIREYNLKFNFSLNFKKLGYNSLIAMCKNMDNIFTIDRPNNLSDWKLYPAGTALPKIDNSVKNPSEKTWCDVDSSVSIEDGLPGIPIDDRFFKSNCMDKYDCIRVLETPHIDKRFELYVSDINDPLDFYYQICSPEHSGALHEMMINLNKFYKNTTEDYSMTEGIMKNGQYLAAPYNDYYHRAFIREIGENNVLEVFYIDYGTIYTVETNQVRQLPREFADLPAQAVRGSLAGNLRLLNWDPMKHMNETKRLIASDALSGRVVAVDINEKKTWLELKSKSVLNIVDEMKKARILQIVDNTISDNLTQQLETLNIAKGHSPFYNENKSELVLFNDNYCPRSISQNNLEASNASLDDLKTCSHKSVSPTKSILSYACSPFGDIKKASRCNSITPTQSQIPIYHPEITLMKITNYNGTYLEIWKMAYGKTVRRFNDRMCIAEQIARVFTISEEEECNMLSEFYSMMDSKSYRCVQHSTNLSDLIVNIMHNGKSGCCSGDTIDDLEIVQDVTAGVDHLLFVPFDDFVDAIESYNKI